ncbi:hypothetical protein IQ230_15915 [Gloeocapsopsis crepidinum LEGE 06123]|uniref:Uncharacterized protein n=1 Tax=Gloeocapsopsis crepidinum LEGE 06123 TaxID=588587 RepID=A0ABR9UU64_9CHRO|nr:hypothetical protein [Gloeocapsopsis crepidinum]MBE9191809.1 hypothetical protein [Gloeocapsopsis crepidinum LEGE 06123]
MHHPDFSKWLTTAYLLAYQVDEDELTTLAGRKGWRQRLQDKLKRTR